MGQSKPWLLVVVSIVYHGHCWEEEKWCNTAGTKCRGEMQSLKEISLDHTAGRGFNYPIDWNGDGLIDLIHAETNFTVFPSDDEPWNKSTAVLRYFRRQDDGTLLREVGPSSPDGLQVPVGFMDFADWDGTGAGVICCHSKNGRFRLVWLQRQRLHESKTCGDVGDELIDFGESENSDPYGPYVPGYHTCQAPRAVDFDGDGDLDLILAVSGSVYLLERLDSGGLGPKKLLVSGPPSTGWTSAEVADWDGDGRLDVILSTDSENMYFKALESGRFQFLSGSDAPRSLRTSFLAGLFMIVRIADWDGDGHADVFVCSRAGKYPADYCEVKVRDVTWIGSDSVNAFASLPDINHGNNLYIVDWDNENGLDLVVQTYDDLSLYSRLPDGQLSTSPKHLRCPCIKKWDVKLTYIIDWDMDGRLDFLCVNKKWPGLDPKSWILSMSRHLPNGSFAEPSFLLELDHEMIVDVVDWNNDDRLGVVLSSGRVALSDPAGNFTFVELPKLPTGAVAAADWNGDGLVDLITYKWENRESLSRLTPWMRQSNGSVIPWAKMEVEDSGCSLSVFRFADWDGDGRQDVILGHICGDRLTWLRVGMWSRGCMSSVACTLRGTCNLGNSECICQQGYSSADCSMCQQGFFSEAGAFFRCGQCAGSTGTAVCSARGVCNDDVFAQTHGLGTQGNGSCWCNGPSFGGTDANGLTTCASGACGPAYMEVGGFCAIDQFYILKVSLFSVILLCLLLLLPFILGRAIPVEDISLDGGAVVITTAVPHYLLAKPWMNPKVTCNGTCHASLDGKIFLAKAVESHPNRLVLMTGPGEALKLRADASRGWLQICRFRAAFCFGYFLPFGLFWWVLLCGAVALYTVGNMDEIHSVAVLGAAALVALGKAIWHWMIQTPLDRRIVEFQKQIQRENPQPSRVPRGALRAISIQQLLQFHEKFHVFIRDRNMYYVVGNLLQPLTYQQKVSYAELVGPSEVIWFVSHFWGNAFRDFKNALEHHNSWAEADMNTYWICSFSNNQWAVSEELGEDCETSSFFLAIKSPSCRGTTMVLDSDVKALSRSWCLFEVLQTRLASEISEAATAATAATVGSMDYHGLIFCTSSGVLGSGSGMDIALTVAKRLTNLRLEDAEASSADDKRMIDDRVRATEGGFEATNGFVRATIRVAVEKAQLSFESDLSDVVLALGVHD